MVASPGQPRFLTLADVAEVLNTSQAQVYALVRRGELRAIKIGGRGQWRVETTELEAFIERMYAQTDAETGWAHSGSPQRGEVAEGQQVDGPVVP
jgi:excisionase family DNA binding protein